MSQVKISHNAFVRKRRESSLKMLVIITAGFLISITGFTVFTKAALKESISDDTPVTDVGITLPDAGALSEPKRIILKALYSIYPAGEGTDPGKEAPDYVKHLKEYIIKPETVIDHSNAVKAADKLKMLESIINYEKSTDIGKMSVDGSRVALRLLEQAYEFCGLIPSFGADNRIETIKDISGSIIYDEALKVKNIPVHTAGIAAICIILPALLLPCLSIAKKNRLFVKEVITDGFDKKEYA